MKEYWVYIATNTSRTLYTGVTNDLRRQNNRGSASLLRMTRDQNEKVPRKRGL